MHTGTVHSPERKPFLAEEEPSLTGPNLVLRALYLISGAMVGMALSAWALGLHYNTSGSVGPTGLYQWQDGTPKRGDLVLACLPPTVAKFGVERGYVTANPMCAGGAEPVIKRLAALPGDMVVVRENELLVGPPDSDDDVAVYRTAEPKDRDSAGRPLPHLPLGTYHLKPGDAWLMGSAPNSWDSRYFGPVPLRDIQYKVAPVSLWVALLAPVSEREAWISEAK